jgi:hypothetical protein
MARIAIRFVDHDGKATGDFIEGLPVVAVNIYVGITYQSTPNEVLDTVKLMKRVDALIDTGSNTTMIGRALAGSQAPLGNVPSQNQAEPGIGSVYGALVQIEGLDRPYPIEVGLANLIPGLAMLLGRDMLSQYRLVFDTPNKEFYLETVLQ